MTDTIKTCNSCEHSNPADARFCNKCGSALATVCSTCQKENPPESRFCNRCGGALGAGNKAPPSGSNGKSTAPGQVTREPRAYTPKHLADKILESKSALEGERKQVTVLFADVEGSMELAEQLDPERWHELLEGFFEILTAGVHRFEGTVNQYTGDGIMALFGAPIAHEDHAHRACHASLYLRDRLNEYAEALRVDPGIDFSFRIGLNSGEVIVAAIGDDLRMDYTAQGHTVGLAQRMEQLAPANGITLSEHTQRIVEGLFDMNPLGVQTIKGSREAVAAFVLEGARTHRTRLDTSRARGLSRLVGRSNEMAALDTALETALSGSGRVGAVVGEAGVGKSRLCAEFVEHCREGGLRVYEAHCPAHGKTIPYLPLLELLRDLFAITEQDTAREARQKIAAEPALLGDDLADDRALVFELLDVADPENAAPQLDPALRQRRLFGFLRRLIQLRTEEEAIVVLIDDLHWIDPGSDQFVAQLVEAASTTRTLLLVNFRPEYTAAWLRKSWVMQLPVAPLGTVPLAELVQDRVGKAPSVQALPALIEARSEGNPFFAEEILHSLIETKVLVGERGAYELTTDIDAVEVPASVKALLAARIDRLGEQEKRVLHDAATIGKEFARPLLEAVVEVEDTAALDNALDALLAAELIQDHAVYPIVEYTFKHPLTHEVALNAQLSGARRARHEKVARAIEAAEPDRLGERASLLAHHWEQAGEAMRAAAWHVRAARRISRTDLSTAHEHWSQARRLLSALEHGPERSRLLLDVYPELINTLDRLGADQATAAAVHHEAIDLARLAQNKRSEALIEGAYAQLVSSHQDFDAMLDHASRAVLLAEDQDDVAVRLFAHHWQARCFAWLGRFDECIEVFDRNLAIGGGDAAAEIEVLGWRPYVESSAIRAACLGILGRPQEALEFVESFPRLERRAGSSADLSSAASDRIWACWYLGDAPLARRCSEEALLLAERFGSDRNVVYALLTCGIASTLGLRFEEGRAFLERARERIVTTGAGGEWSGFIDGQYALCLAALGDRERTLELARDHVAQEWPDLVQSAFFPWARALRLSGDSSDPRALDSMDLDALVERSLGAIERSGALGFLPLILLERAAIARLRGDVDSMVSDLAEARRLFAQMGATGWEDYARSIEGGG